MGNHVMKIAKWGLKIKIWFKMTIAYLHWYLICASFMVLLYLAVKRKDVSSLLTESFRLLDRKEQLLLQLLVAFVGGQIQPVKAANTQNRVRHEHHLPVTSTFILKTHQVWLRGSQVSLPTFSMQNFCGPLLPGGRRIRRKGFKCVCVTWVREINVFLVVKALREFLFSLMSEKQIDWRLTHELSEAPQRKPAGAHHKLHQTQTHLVIHLLHQLHTNKETDSDLTHFNRPKPVSSSRSVCFEILWKPLKPKQKSLQHKIDIKSR